MKKKARMVGAKPEIEHIDCRTDWLTVFLTGCLSF